MDVKSIVKTNNQGNPFFIKRRCFVFRLNPLSAAVVATNAA